MLVPGSTTIALMLTLPTCSRLHWRAAISQASWSVCSHACTGTSMADHLLLLTVQSCMDCKLLLQQLLMHALAWMEFIDSCVISILAAADNSTSWCLAYCMFTTRQQLWPSSSGHWDEHLPRVSHLAGMERPHRGCLEGQRPASGAKPACPAPSHKSGSNPLW